VFSTVAPEIISLQGASTASDIWSLGCTIVELLEGKPPWAELDSNMAVLFKIVEEEWPIPAYYSPELKDFLGLCFKKNPSDRPTAETLFDHEWIRNEIGIDPVSQFTFRYHIRLAGSRLTSCSASPQPR